MAAKFLISHHLGNDRLWANVGALVITLVLIASVALGTLSLIGLGRQNIVACRAVNQLRVVLVGIEQRGAKALPTISYYKSHPVELRFELQQVAAVIKSLQPVPC